MSRIEIYTPWREAPESLRARSVGRSPLLSRIGQSARAFGSGKPPLPLYLFGPRGIGKSHIVALLRPEFERLGIKVILLSEDIPAISSADSLLQRAKEDPDVPAWMRGPKQVEREGPTRPTLLVIEGLDRRFSELGSTPTGRQERQRLRHAWDQNPHVWVIGTGVELSDALTEAGEPFFGWFDPEPVGSLSDEEATALLDKVVTEEVRLAPHWRGRREALIPLAGGSPRVLVTLAETCSSQQGADEASEALLTAVDRFTAHYQLRFRDLSGVSQQIVEKLAFVSGELGPSELARSLEMAAQGVGTQCRRLVDDGVLSRREEGGATWYRIAEPLFRFWLEYRNGPWRSTRVAVAASLLQALYSAEEIIELWWETQRANPVLPRAVNAKPAQAQARIAEAFTQAIAAKDGEGVEKALTKAKDAAVIAKILRSGDLRRLAANDEMLNRARPHLNAIPGLLPTLDFAHTVSVGGPPRRAFVEWLNALSPLQPVVTNWALLTNVLLQSLDANRGPGGPWSLKPAERQHLSKLPVLRAQLLLRGRLRSHAGILFAEDLQGAPIRRQDPDLGPLLHAAMLKRAPRLANRVLDAVLSEPTRALLPSLPINPTPGVAFPDRPADFSHWLIAEIVSGRPLAATLSWSATLAKLSDEEFSAVCTALRAQSAGPPAAVASARSGMIALGLEERERLTQWVQVLPEPWRPHGLVAQALCDQLAELRGGRLHPELARLRTFLSPASE